MEREYNNSKDQDLRSMRQHVSALGTGKYSGITDDALELLWNKVQELRDSVVEIGHEIHTELQNRKTTIASLGKALQSNSGNDKMFIKNESSSDESDELSASNSDTFVPGPHSVPMNMQRESIIADIKNLTDVQEIAKRFDDSMISSAAFDMRTHLEKTISSFEIILLDVEKQIEQSRQEILDRTFEHASSIYRNIKKHFQEYQISYEKRNMSCGEKQKAILQKMYELQQRLESCCHGSPSIAHIEHKLRILTEDENKIRSFLDHDKQEHRNMLYYINWMDKLTQPETVPKCLSSAFVGK